MRVEGVPLNAGALGNHADRGECRADRAVQLDDGFDNAPPRGCLGLGTSLQGVGPGHGNFITRLCASIVDALSAFDYTQVYYQIR
jgi:hypothetical protein